MNDTRPAERDAKRNTANEPAHRAHQFIAAFNDIEAHFRSVLQPKGYEAFGSMARRMENSGAITSLQLMELEAFVDLRNAISHGSYREGEPIAEPRTDTVAAIEKLRDVLLSPPQVVQVIGQQKIYSFTPEDSLSEVFHIINEKGISQYPIYHEGSYQALLTTTMVAQWFADWSLRHNAGEDVGALESVRVGEVIDFAHSRALRDHAVFAAADVDAATAVTMLRHPELPRVLIVTEHGKKSQKPIRIVGAADVIPLLDALEEF
ncbi:CBS domain-containing protein [Corynebacterium sp. 11A]|uniref:CBS domain-containing protein n=1 Tax=Corynebacterium sp. 11A TaxID=2080510 RepID=UPI00124C2EFE|nr:CBS domain-containing protein [Corynebacterium sp. 11A]